MGTAKSGGRRTYPISTLKEKDLDKLPDCVDPTAKEVSQIY